MVGAGRQYNPNKLHCLLKEEGSIQSKSPRGCKLPAGRGCVHSSLSIRQGTAENGLTTLATNKAKIRPGPQKVEPHVSVLPPGGILSYCNSRDITKSGVRDFCG